MKPDTKKILAFYKQHNIKLVPEYKFFPTRRFRFDFAIPELKIAIEMEGGIWIGGRHTRPVGFIKDMEKYNLAACEGWLILRTPPSKIMTEDFLFYVTTTILNKEESRLNGKRRRNKTSNK